MLTVHVFVLNSHGWTSGDIPGEAVGSAGVPGVVAGGVKPCDCPSDCPRVGWSDRQRQGQDQGDQLSSSDKSPCQSRNSSRRMTTKARRLIPGPGASVVTRARS